MLTLDPVVLVNVAVGAANVSVSSYDVGLIVSAASETMTAATRAKTYANLEAILADGFTVESPEYLAAQKYFGVTPKPRMVVIGVAGSGETVAVALDAIREKNADWYGLYWCGATAQQVLDIDAYLNSINYGMQFATVSGTAAAVTTSGNLPTLAERVTRRTMLLLTATAVEAAAVMGVAMGCSNEYSGIAWQLCYKTIDGITPANLSQEDVNTLLAANCNVYVTRAYTRNMLERGATVGGLRVDEVIAIDRMSADIQTVCLSLIAGNAAKLPQNNTTTTRFISAITEVLENFVAIGYIQRGIWAGDGFGNVATGDVLEKGYAIWADSFDNQSIEDRRARKGMPIRVGICFCGSVESIVINVTVQE